MNDPKLSNPLYNSWWLSLLLLPGIIGGQVVFPGDLNHDGRVDLVDLIPLAVAYGREGPPRPNASLEWQAQPADLWDIQLPSSGIDVYSVDANGDGVIDSLDLDGVVFNYDSLQPPGTTEPYHLNDTFRTEISPEIVILYDRPAAGNGDTVQLTVRLEVPFPDQYPPTSQPTALAFTLAYDPTFVQDESVTVAFVDDADDLLFLAATPSLTTGGRSTAPGRIDLAAGGRGSGALIDSRDLFRITIVIEDMILLPPGTILDLSVVSPIMVTGMEEYIGAGSRVGDLLLSSTAEPVNAVVNPILFPNPARNDVSLRLLPGKSAQITLIGPSGKILRKERYSRGGACKFSLHGLPSGGFWLVVEQDGRSILRRLVIH